MLGVSKLLSDVVYEKMRYGIGSTYTIEATFHQSTTGLEIEPTKVVSMSIEQDFEGATVDKIAMKCEFVPIDLYNLLSNTQDLKVTIIQRRWEREFYSVARSEDPDIYTFKVFISNPLDMMKKIPPGAIKQTKETDFDREQLKTPIEIDMQLMPDIDYNLIKKQGNVLLADTTVQGIILYMCGQWGIKKTYIVQPDNTQVFESYLVEALTDLQKLVHDIQKKKGIYNKGVACYFCNETLYVYPPFDTDPDKSEILNIFKLPENSVDGGDIYHYQEDATTLYIVSFSPMKNQNTATASTENKGNAVSIRQGDSSMDIARDVDNSGKITLNPEASIIAKVNSSVTPTANQVTAQHAGTTNNAYEQLSSIFAGQVELISLGWIHAKPWLIIPGMRVILHYDDTSKGTAEEDFYSTTTGIIKACKYNLYLQGQPGGYIYRWDANLVIGVPPREINEDQTSSPNFMK